MNELCVLKKVQHRSQTTRLVCCMHSVEKAAFAFYITCARTKLICFLASSKVNR